MRVRTKVSAKTIAHSPSQLGMSGRAGRRCLIGLMLALLVMAMVCAPVFAAGAAQPKARSQGHFSLDFINTDLVDVLKALATQSGVNIVLTSGCKGQTTLSLRNVTLEEALRLVSASNGLDYAWVDVAYVIGKPEEVRAMRVKELSSRAVALRQIQPKYAQEVLSKVCPEATVTYQDGNPGVVLIGTEAVLNHAERCLSEIDITGPADSKMVSLNCVSAVRVLPLIKEAVPNATIQLGPAENSLLVTGDGVCMAQVRSMVAAIDVPPTPNQAHTKVYEIKYASPSELKAAIDDRFPSDLVCIYAPRGDTPVVLKSSSSGSGGSSGADSNVSSASLLSSGAKADAIKSAAEAAGTKFVSQKDGETTMGGAGLKRTTHEAPKDYMSVVDRLIFTGSEYTVERAIALAQELDSPPRQVRIKAIISRINRDKLRSLGVDWSSSLGPLSSVPVTIREERDPEDSLLKFGKFVRTPLTLTAEIQAMEQQGYAKILSEPCVMTLDGRQVAFHSGDKLFYLQAAGQSALGGIQYTVQYIDVGVTLIVTPQINGDGEITMTLAPSFSRAIFRTQFGSEVPVVNERATVTTVRVKNKESAVIAGLVEDNTDSTVKKIPLLGDIPIIGYLFRNDRKEHVQDELVIIVTPEIIP